MLYPNPYDYASDLDYYEAMDEYNRTIDPEYNAEAIDRAYDEYRDRMLFDNRSAEEDK